MLCSGDQKFFPTIKTNGLKVFRTRDRGEVCHGEVTMDLLSQEKESSWRVTEEYHTATICILIKQ